MSSILPNYEYDIFISYRQNDNKYDGWVTEYVDNLQKEIDATLKNPVSIYFDENPHDGLQDTHVVGESLKKKLKCLIFIPIISQTYCDESSFAWQHEFLTFNEMAKADELGMNITLANGNVTSRILAVRIHDIDIEDQQVFEQTTGSPLRAIDFIYKEAGVNRSLKPADDKKDNLNNTSYRNQMNKVAHAIKDLGTSITRQSEGKSPKASTAISQEQQPLSKPSINAVFMALAVIVLLALGYWGYTNYLSAVEKDVADLLINDKSIAVLPFINTRPNPETDYLGFAIANQVIGELDYIKNITVRPSASIRKYANKIVDPKTVGDELSVEYLVIGNYLNEDENIRLTIELIELKTNEILWREEIGVDFRKTFELQDIVAKKVVEGLNIKLTPKELNRLSRDISSNPIAYDYYLKGISYPLSIKGDKFAVEMLLKSIVLDSNYAPTYSHLGLRTQLISQFDLQDPALKIEAENYYLKALSINNELPSAQADLAMLFVETNRIDKAINLGRQMVEINPNNAVAHFSLSYIYRYGGMLSEAIEELEKAVALDPKNPRFRRLGLAYLNVGDYKKAFEIFDLDKGSAYSLGFQSQMLVRQGKNKEAMAYFERIIQMKEEKLWVKVAIIHQAIVQHNVELGRKTMIELERANISDGEAWYYWAGNYAMLNDLEGALRCLWRTVDSGYFNYPFMLTDSFLDPIRNDPEFQKILAKAKAKHEAFKEKYF